MNPWLVIPIMFTTILADWAVMIMVGRHLRKTLSKTAEDAVLNGAEQVKGHIFGLIPLLIPSVVSTIKAEVLKDEDSATRAGV